MAIISTFAASKCTVHKHMPLSRAVKTCDVLQSLFSLLDSHQSQAGMLWCCRRCCPHCRLWNIHLLRRRLNSKLLLGYCGGRFASRWQWYARIVREQWARCRWTTWWWRKEAVPLWWRPIIPLAKSWPCA